MDNETLVVEIAAAVRARLGRPDAGLQRAVQQRLQAEPGAPLGVVHAERIVVSANGVNRRGIVARLTAVLAEMQGDIHDIRQTRVGDYFTMILVVDVARATADGTRFTALKERLEEAGRAMGTHVVVLHDDLLQAMHIV